MLMLVLEKVAVQSWLQSGAIAVSECEAKVGVAKDVAIDYGPGCCKTEVGGCNRLDDGAVR